MQLTQKLNPDDLSMLFNGNQNLEINLRAVRGLRNAVSHHRMLFVYEDFEECTVDNLVSDSLTANVINLSNLINPFYKPFIINELNRAKNDNDDPRFVDTIPSKAYFKLGENNANK